MEFSVWGGVIGTLFGVGAISLYQLFQRKRLLKKKSIVKKGNSDSNSETDSSTDDFLTSVKNIPIPNLLVSSIRLESQRAFELLRSIFPERVFIVPLRYFFPLNNETLMLLALSPELTEPITSGHPQSVYNALVYPLKLILDTPVIDFFGFEVVHGGVKDVFSSWNKGNYVLNNLKGKKNIAQSSPVYSTHVVPLFIAHTQQNIQNAFLTKRLLAKQFTLSDRCLNAASSSSSSSSSSSLLSVDSSVKLPVILLAYFRIVNNGRL